MNPEAQRIAIAEACGWTVSAKGWWSHPTLPDNGGAMPDAPDYLNDLNATHEAEKALQNHQHQFFYRQLERIVSGKPYDEEGHYGTGWLFHNVHATAARRAEAFLRAIGKWKDKS